ncbi:hypothetical protein CT153_07355 [Aeromonas veronii]|nr:hypothetical protein CT153_07355 [Aeromonas veronii]
MTSNRIRDLFSERMWIGGLGKDSAPLGLQKVVNSLRYCMGIQCFTVERLRADKRGPDRMDSLTELEHVLETLDLTRVEEEKIARILERLRDELNAAS